jgi:mobilization protein
LNDRKTRDNAAKASIHFAKAEQIAFFHNSREAFLPETSNEELRQKNECDKTAEEARALFEELSAKGDENFLKNCGRRTNMKAENKLWESVMNLREHHTLEDVQRVNARIQKITGFIPIQTSIHRDEGHTDEKTGEFVLNVHAQTTWLTQDPETGKSMAYLLFGRKDIYRKIQDIVAEELGMACGQSAEITGAKHFRNMRDYKQIKRAEAEKQAEWEAKQAEREARQAEWEKKLPEIMAARRKNEQFLNNKVDWETLKVANRAFLAWHDISTDILGYPNPNGNLIVEQAKGALASIFRLFGSVSQLAVFLLTRTEARDLKLKNTMDVYKVSENLQRAVNLVANDTTNDHRKIAEKIQSVFSNLPHDKRQELIELAILHAPNDEIKNDIRALVNGDFHKIARTEQAQKRIENRDLRQSLREYSEEIKRIRDELRAMDEENRILVAAEREILKSRGAGRAEYAEQESQNRERLEGLKQLKDEVKDLKKTIDDQKQREEKDAEIIAEQAQKIKELNDKIAEITKENVAKQKELEQEKAKRLITPQQLDRAEQRISELEDKIKEQEFIFYGKADEIEAVEFEKEIEKQIITPQMPPRGAFDIIDELEAEKIDKSKPKPEPVKPEPEQPKPADDNLNIFGYARPTPEPRRRFSDDYEPRRPREIDRPKYVEPEPEKIEPISEPEEPIFRDPWQKIENDFERWKKCESEVEKNFLKMGILSDIEEYEKSGVPPHRQMSLNSYVRALNYDAEAIRKMRELELDRKRQQAELDKKYEDVRAKNVKQEDDARQTAIKKKKKDELEMGGI